VRWLFGFPVSPAAKATLVNELVVKDMEASEARQVFGPPDLVLGFIDGSQMWQYSNADFILFFSADGRLSMLR
jgi:hypothetical protein